MATDEDTLVTPVSQLARQAGAKPGSRGELPVGEPQQEHGSLEDKRSELIAKIEEISGALRYMGTGHPRRMEMAAQLERMQKMLEQMNQAMGR